MMVTESTITPDVETQPASGGKVKKRIPQDASVLLSEIDVDRLSEADLTRYIHLCDFYLTHYEEDLDPDTEKLLKWFDFYDLDMVETKLANRTPLSKKLASARRYRNRRQHILNKKKQAQAKKINKVIARKMAFSKKTRTGQDKKKYHVEMRSLDEYMKYVKLPPLPMEVPETRQFFEIDGKIYSTPSSIIKSIKEGLEYAIKNNCENYIEFENGLKVDVRQLIKAWR
jgi:hypothetical protein